MILLYLYDFELKLRKQILKISFQFSVGFHSKILGFLYFPHNFGYGRSPTMIGPPKHHPKLKPSGIPYFLTKISDGFRRKLEKTRGVKFQLVLMLKNGENLLFSMMWLYPIWFSINSRLQKCNLFACTPRMNNSRLSKQAMYSLCLLGQTKVMFIMKHNITVQRRRLAVFVQFS